MSTPSVIMRLVVSFVIVAFCKYPFEVSSEEQHSNGMSKENVVGRHLIEKLVSLPPFKVAPLSITKPNTDTEDLGKEGANNRELDTNFSKEPNRISRSTKEALSRTLSARAGCQDTKGEPKSYNFRNAKEEENGLGISHVTSFAEYILNFMKAAHQSTLRKLEMIAKGKVFSKSVWNNEQPSEREVTKVDRISENASPEPSTSTTVDAPAPNGLQSVNKKADVSYNMESDEVNFKNLHVQQEPEQNSTFYLRSEGQYQRSRRNDSAPWTCQERRYWRQLSQNSYPRYVLDTVCGTARCNFGHNSCSPITYHLHVLKPCAPPLSCTDTRLPSSLRRSWIFVTEVVNVGCRCTA